MRHSPAGKAAQFFIIKIPHDIEAEFMATARKSRFLRPLAIQVAGGVSIRDAAEIVNCAEQTGYNIARTTEFRQLVGELRTAATDTAAGKLTKASALGVDVLSEIALDKTQTATARVAAIKVILSNLRPIVELCELRGRLDKIEEAQSQFHRVN